MIISGGVYGEVCLWPHLPLRIFGSGGRAAAALAALSPSLTLRSFCPDVWKPVLQSSAAASGYVVDLATTTEAIIFSYFHPLSTPLRNFERPIFHSAPLEADDDVVLRFDMLEGHTRVRAKRAVFDPQTGGVDHPFHANGSTCDELAVVLNETDAARATRQGPAKAGFALLDKWDAAVVVIKRGWRGATVFVRGKEPIDVPAYQTDRVYKVGSGDVFSAVFAHYWGNEGLDPHEAANEASLAVAHYVETRALPIPTSSSQTRIPFQWSKKRRPHIYLAGPFFNLPQRWLVEEALIQLHKLGVEVYSPLHENGRAIDNKNVAIDDLKGLQKTDSVLALVDGYDVGTLVEIGFARSPAVKTPVVAFGELIRTSELTMLEGTQCEVVSDFATALYRAIWAAAA